MTTTKELLAQTEENMKRTIDATQREFATIRTGRASPSLVEGIKVEYYGTQVVLKQLATITTPDPKLIVIQPWDPKAMGDIERAILKSDLGINPVNDGRVIRMSIPQLTKERKDELIKIVKKIAENGKISLRTVRREANEHAEKMEKEEHISEDERFKAQGDIQRLIDKYMKEVDALLEKKEKEILEG